MHLPIQDPGFDPWVRKIPWRRKWQPTPIFFSGKSHGQKNLVGYSLRGHEESDMTEHAYNFMSIDSMINMKCKHTLKIKITKTNTRRKTNLKVLY